MNGAEVHLMLNHVPFLGTLFVAGLLVYGLARGEDAVVRVAFWAMVVVGLVAVPTYLSGEAAEDVVEEALEVSHDIIESHEHFAVWGLVATGIATLGAVAGLFLYRFRPIGRGFATLLLVLTLGAFATLAYTAYLGGRINHPEIRSGGPMTGEGATRDGRGAESSSARTGRGPWHSRRPEDLSSADVGAHGTRRASLATENPLNCQIVPAVGA